MLALFELLLVFIHQRSRQSKGSKKEQRLLEDSPGQQQQCRKIMTMLVESPSPLQLPQWNLRSMWELASILNFLQVSWKTVIFAIEFALMDVVIMYAVFSRILEGLMKNYIINCGMLSAIILLGLVIDMLD